MPTLPSHTPHRTPLRRVSQGSLFALSRSEQSADAPHGLGFLEPVMSQLVDESEALQANVEGLRHLSESLRTFNESFASWLYVMDMNALTTDWLQAPTDASFVLARRRAEEDARIAAEAALKAAQPPLPPPPPSADYDADKTTYTEHTDFDTTYTNVTDNTAKSAPKAKRKGKPKLSAKEKKERSLAIEKIISCLPLEFRGSDPNLRRNMESIIETMMDSGGRGIKLIELIAPPDLNQARVNKCLIALVNRKIVQKDSSTGTVLYHWRGLP